MIVEIDESAGFCRGVKRTIEIAEKVIADNPGRKVYILGELIHNPGEVQRLEKMGLVTINHNDLAAIDPAGSTVIIRAHGEPPETYDLLKKFHLEFTDTTCSIVSSLHEIIARYSRDGYKILIYGNRNHPEVIGLLGSCGYKAVVLESPEAADEFRDFEEKNLLLSQTTKSKKDFNTVREIISKNISNLEVIEPDSVVFDVKDSTCRYVNRREKLLVDFVENHDLVVLVAGRNSSNGRMLFELCRSINKDTVFIEDPSEISTAMLIGRERIGITGATSTPGWQLEETKDRIIELLK